MKVLVSSDNQSQITQLQVSQGDSACCPAGPRPQHHAAPARETAGSIRTSRCAATLLSQNMRAEDARRNKVLLKVIYPLLGVDVSAKNCLPIVAHEFSASATVLHSSDIYTTAS